MTANPADDPNFTGVKQPAFDALVTGHTRAAAHLDRLAGELWEQLTKLGVDTTPALRIRALAGRIREEASELQRRQRLVRDLERHPGGGFCVPSGTFWKLTEPKTPNPRPGPPVHMQRAAESLSFELQDAMFLPPAYVPAGSSLDDFSARERAVMSWIQANRDIILREARRWNISPKAIVAAIAWEALQNVEPNIGPGSIIDGQRKGELGQLHPQIPPIPGFAAHQSIGPGKVHIDTPVVHQVEDRGYLPYRGLFDRADLLRTPDGSIRYIAAIMGGFADVTYPYVNPGQDIRNDVPMLTQLYQGSDLDAWERHMRTEYQRGDGFNPKNPMAVWSKDPHVVRFLDVALKAPDGTDPPDAQDGPRVPPTHTTPVTPRPGPKPTPP